MPKRFSFQIGLIALPLMVVLLSACGINMAGEPKIRAQIEIVPSATPPHDLTIRGSLVQATADADPVGAGVTVDLWLLNRQGQEVQQITTTTDDEGAFVFEDAPRMPDHYYFVETDYAGVAQGVQVPIMTGEEEEVQADITVYEWTADPTSVSVMGARTLINYAPIDQSIIEVQLDLLLVNTGDRIVGIEETAANGWPVSVVVELPPGSFGIQVDEPQGSGRFEVEVLEGIPTVKDTWPLRPSEVHDIRLFYYLPYETGATLDQNVNYPVLSSEILLPNDTVDFQSEQFSAEGEFRYRAQGLQLSALPEGTQIPPDSTDRTLIRVHELNEPIRADTHLIFTLVGRPYRTIDVISHTTPPATASEDDSGSPLPYILAGAGLTMLALAGILWWRQRGMVSALAATSKTWRPPDPAAGRDALLAALADLEDAYEVGEIDDEVFERRRGILKERLIPLLDEDDGDPGMADD